MYARLKALPQAVDRYFIRRKQHDTSVFDGLPHWIYYYLGGLILLLLFVIILVEPLLHREALPYFHPAGAEIPFEQPIQQ